MTHSEEQLLVLLRAGLWSTAADPAAFPAGETDWDVLFGLARKQTVEGIVYDGLSTLPAGQQPGTALLRRWYAQVVAIERANTLQNRHLVELCALYRQAGIEPVLLKGQGMAYHYPNPLRRRCGDIDLYLGREGYRKARALVKARGLLDAGSKESAKHLTFSYEGTVVENHRLIIQLPNPLHNRRLQVLIRESFAGPARMLSLGGQPVRVPALPFDALFILIHAAIHFFESGVGLRQLCDWARLLYVCREELDRGRLARDIDRLGLRQAWASYGYIAVRHLGLDPAAFPGSIRGCAETGDRILARMLHEGNFGKSARPFRRPKNRLDRKLWTLRQYTKRLGEMSSFHHQKIFWPTMFFIRNALWRLIRHK